MKVLFVTRNPENTREEPFDSLRSLRAAHFDEVEMCRRRNSRLRQGYVVVNFSSLQAVLLRGVSGARHAGAVAKANAGGETRTLTSLRILDFES